MKKIIIYQEDVERIELLDDDDGDIENFALALAKVLKGSTVSIINGKNNGKNSSLIIRPSKVISILVKDQSKEVKVVPKDVKPKIPKTKSKVKVDIITDVDD